MFDNIDNMNGEDSILSKYKLDYIPTNVVKVTKSTVKRISDNINSGKKPTKSEIEKRKKDRRNAIMGIGQLLVFVSIIYSTTVVLIGVDSVESRVALFPQALFGLIILVKAFSKLYK